MDKTNEMNHLQYELDDSSFWSDVTRLGPDLEGLFSSTNGGGGRRHGLELLVL